MDLFDFNEKFEFDFDANEFSVKVCSKVCDALDKGKKMCDIISIGKDDYEFNMVAEDIEFLDILEKNLKRVEESEDYELCARMVYWISKLKEDGKG
tara:strand:+ start:288 stop:575 length:288 start_codon:yes stop_codon:yes gene_type:complete